LCPEGGRRQAASPPYLRRSDMSLKKEVRKLDQKLDEIEASLHEKFEKCEAKIVELEAKIFRKEELKGFLENMVKSTRENGHAEKLILPDFEKATAIQEKTKICPNCGIKKPLSEFHRDANAKSGYHSWCRDCKNKQLRELRKHKPKFSRDDLAISKIAPAIDNVTFSRRVQPNLSASINFASRYHQHLNKLTSPRETVFAGISGQFLFITNSPSQFESIKFSEVRVYSGSRVVFPKKSSIPKKIKCESAHIPANYFPDFIQIEISKAINPITGDIEPMEVKK